MSGFSSTIRAVARIAAQAQREQQRALRDATRQAKAEAREAVRDYLTARTDEAEALSQEIQEREQDIETLLANALAANPALDLRSRFQAFVPENFNESKWSLAPPQRMLSQPLGFWAKLLPGSSRRHQEKIDTAELRHQEAEAEFQQNLQRRDKAASEFRDSERKRKEQIDRENAHVRDLIDNLAAGERSSVLSYFREVISRSLKGEPDAISAEIGYSPDSRHLVIDLELPDVSTIPDEVRFKYVKSADRIDPVPRPATKRKALYSNLICQIALKCMDTVFRSGAPIRVVECVTINGMLDTVDPATGQNVRVCLLSVRVTADTFRSLNLSQVQPEQCLRLLKAAVSRAPTELVPVKPLVELDMLDPRFVATMDVLSNLDQRQNLMDLTPTEFEGLITNLFGTMGLDTRQTQPSRDGGVDCVAFDSRPVFGGKVVIQAKRYKNTVGVSAVRDLFGTVQNEGASKGILVTTSGYGKAAFEFAKGKPLELLDGGNLLHLLAEHAGVEARIVMPEHWVDAPLHGE